MRTNWERDGDYWTYMHILDDGTDMHHVASLKRETELAHELFQFLAKLNIIRYDRGYDGIYYEIGILARK